MESGSARALASAGVSACAVASSARAAASAFATLAAPAKRRVPSGPRAAAWWRRPPAVHEGLSRRELDAPLAVITPFAQTLNFYRIKFFSGLSSKQYGDGAASQNSA